MGINYNKVGESIRARRKELEITQKDLAEKLNISQGYISDLEKGNIENPSLNKLEIITSELNMDISKLLEASSKSNQINDEISILAAHLEGEELTEEEMEDLTNYIDYIISKRDKK